MAIGQLQSTSLINYKQHFAVIIITLKYSTVQGLKYWSTENKQESQAVASVADRTASQQTISDCCYTTPPAVNMLRAQYCTLSALGSPADLLGSRDG